MQNNAHSQAKAHDKATSVGGRNNVGDTVAIILLFFQKHTHF